MRARYYNIDIKRFINQDVVIGNIDSSASLNRYAYVEGNPVSYLDPFGLAPWDTSFIHETLEYFINYLSYASAASIVISIVCCPLISAYAAVIASALGYICATLSIINSLFYSYDAANSREKKQKETAIVNAIFDFSSAMLCIFGPISIGTRTTNFCVSKNLKSAADWLIGYIWDTLGDWRVINKQEEKLCVMN